MKLVFLFLILATMAMAGPCAAVDGKKAPTPPSAVDCSSVIYDMVDCITYLSVGSSQSKVDKACCQGLKSVISVDPSCLCVGLQSSAEMGIDLNFTRALNLPAACGMPTPPEVAKCSLSPSPSPSPSAPPPKTTDPPQVPPSSSPSAPPPSTIAPPPSHTPPSSSPSATPPSSSEPASPVSPPAGSSSSPPTEMPPAPSETPSKPKVAAPAPASTGGASSISMSIFMLISMIVVSFSFV